MKIKNNFIRFGLVVWVAVFIFIITTVQFALSEPTTKGSDTHSWRVVCGTEGGLAYGISGGLSKFIRSRVSNVQLLPEPGGTVAGCRLVSRGEVTATYGNPLLLKQAHKNTGPFKEKPLGTRKPLQTIYFYPVTMFIVTKADSGINSLSDLEGKKISLGVPAVGLTSASVELFKDLGLWEKVNNKWISLGDLADSLKGGVVDAVLGWNVGDFAAGGAVKKMDLYAKCRVLTMSNEQMQMVNKSAGLAFRYTPTKSAFSQDIGTEKIPGWALWYGFHWASDADEEAVYRVVKALFEDRSELSKISKAFNLFASDPKEVTVSAISAAPDIPVHPGAAKYYKEIGIWRNNWVNGQTKTK
jgi:TRAP transporter TAXI family solute receptor